MRNKALLFLILLVLLLSAVRAQQSTSTSAAEPTTAPQPRTLTVLAAASLTESFTELGALFESRNPGVTISFNFAGSQQLAQQLDQGAPADVFASANKKQMDVAVGSGRVVENSPQIFATNRLVVVFPKDNPAGLSALTDLSKPGLKLVLADQSAPVGQYSLGFLEKASQDEQFGAAFKDDVLKNLVSYENNVKVVATKVSLGEADAGIIYVSDITVDISAQVGRLDIPDALNTIATYPIATISDSQHPDLTAAFVSLVLSPEGQQVLAKYNFIPVGGR